MKCHNLKYQKMKLIFLNFFDILFFNILTLSHSASDETNKNKIVEIAKIKKNETVLLF